MFFFIAGGHPRIGETQADTMGTPGEEQGVGHRWVLYGVGTLSNTLALVAVPDKMEGGVGVTDPMPHTPGGDDRKEASIIYSTGSMELYRK